MGRCVIAGDRAQLVRQIGNRLATAFRALERARERAVQAGAGYRELEAIAVLPGAPALVMPVEKPATSAAASGSTTSRSSTWSRAARPKT